ncbi:hypothetical protein ACIQ8D_06210 [Streptomyces sp. NPDC096094]|uniref:hypothetical protein n=1 Tax=Streptomyces sp. NPDC096094 TaxID=3366073 RepID=UPI0037FB5BF3
MDAVGGAERLLVQQDGDLAALLGVDRVRHVAGELAALRTELVRQLAHLLLVASALPVIRTDAVWRDIDFLGALVLACGVVPLLLGLSRAGEGHGWDEPLVWGPLLAGVVLLAVFGRVESAATHPIVPFGLFRNRTFTLMITTAFLSAFAMMGCVYLVPLLYQGCWVPPRSRRATFWPR